MNDKCPIDKIVSVSINAITGKVLDVIATGYNYKYLSCKYHNNSYNSMPKFLFGTDDSGQDLFKKAFKGLRISLIDLYTPSPSKPNSFNNSTAGPECP